MKQQHVSKDTARDGPENHEVNGESTLDESLEIEQRILHLLSIYPVISPTMLQGGLGPYTKSSKWRPVLDRLIQDGKVEESQETLITPRGRYNTYSKLRLPGTEVIVPNSVLED